MKLSRPFRPHDAYCITTEGSSPGPLALKETPDFSLAYRLARMPGCNCEDMALYIPRRSQIEQHTISILIS